MNWRRIWMWRYSRRRWSWVREFESGQIIHGWKRVLKVDLICFLCLVCQIQYAWNCLVLYSVFRESLRENPMKSHDLVVWSFFFLLGNTDTTLDSAVQVSCSVGPLEYCRCKLSMSQGLSSRPGRLKVTWMPTLCLRFWLREQLQCLVVHVHISNKVIQSVTRLSI
jgi:hypothetical protein